MIRDFFKKTPIQQRKNESGKEPEIPTGLWRKCNKCGAAIYTEDVIEGHYICPKCNGYFRMHAYRRIEQIIDEGTFNEWDKDLAFYNPLHFSGYEKKVRELQEKTNLDEAIITGKGLICGSETVIGVMDARFLMASMGHNVGEKIARAVERATKEKLPVILFTCSGGARMQEGIVSLMQMAKTSAALKKHSEAGLLYITVLTDPTTGGVTASFAMLGDIILAEPNALIGFAGPRVIEQTMKQKLPAGFQRSEFLLDHGFVDSIVKREEMKDTLSKILKLHKKECVKECVCNKIEIVNLENIKQIEQLNVEQSKLEGQSVEYGNVGESNDCNDEQNKEQLKVEKQEESFVDAWSRVLVSRMDKRPTGLDYINVLFDDFIELHGDRCYGDDGAIVGGIGWFHNIPVTVIAQQKGKNVKDNIKRNFGMPSPEGYRKALRLMKEAEKFHRPIICLVDTPGAFCGMEAEERGQGEAIAKNLYEMSNITVPILSIVIGEGGSGGALAMAVADEVWMLENAIYSILSPEGFASILWKDAKRASEAAEIMKITSYDLQKLGMIEQIIPEKEPATMENIENIKKELEERLLQFLEVYTKISKEALIEHRYNRFRNM